MQDERQRSCDLLVSDDPRADELYSIIARSFGDVSLDHVRGGDERAVMAYVVAWRDARSRLLEHVSSECPDLELPPQTVEALDWEAVQAPFSAWLRSDGPGNGLALDLIARLRNLLIDSANPLLPTHLPEDAAGSAVVDAESPRKFYREVVAALEGKASVAVQIADVFGLNKAELGRLFGVSRQAATDWLENDVPNDRRAKASVVLSTADLLSHRLKTGRLAGVARRRAAAYGGLSMLEMIAADRHDDLLDSVRASFDFAQTG